MSAQAQAQHTHSSRRARARSRAEQAWAAAHPFRRPIKRRRNPRQTHQDSRRILRRPTTRRARKERGGSQLRALGPTTRPFHACPNLLRRQSEPPTFRTDFADLTRGRPFARLLQLVPRERHAHLAARDRCGIAVVDRRRGARVKRCLREAAAAGAATWLSLSPRVPAGALAARSPQRSRPHRRCTDRAELCMHHGRSLTSLSSREC